MDDSPESIARDIAAVSAISAVPSMLQIVCQSTGMGFAAVARVTDGTWTACAVQDNISFGLKQGGQLPVHTTLCIEAKAAREPVVFDNASQDPKYRDHHTPRMYNIESYISVPIVMADGEYFGNLCAIDPLPRSVSKTETVAMFKAFAELIAVQLAQERRAQGVSNDLLDEREHSQLRENFIAVLGHDLRNPLSSISMAAEVLRRSSSDQRIVAIGERLLSASKRMSKLIDDVLDLSRGRLRGGIPMKIIREENLGRWMEDVLEELRAAYPGRVIQGHIDIPRPASCDCVRVQQLLSNLVGNALTHGLPDQPVEARASMAGDVLEIAVLNKGEHVPEEIHAKLFEPFYRPPNSKSEEGLGLGLYICAEIAKGHGGDVSLVSSQEGETTFIARLRV